MTSPLQRCSFSIAITVALITLASMLLAARSYAQQAVGVVTAVKGDAQLTRGTARKPLEFRDDVVLRDIVATQEKSLARILFGGSSNVTVRELSTLEVTEEVLPGGAKRTVYDMSVGAILVRVINKLLGPGDEVQIKTPNAIAAVRGTTIFTRCLARAAQALRCTFSVLSGQLPLTPYGRPPVTLTENTSVSITGDQASGTQISPITTLTTAEAQQILTDSEVRTAAETDGVQSGIAAHELQQATRLASTLVETVAPPIPPASDLQNTSVPSDTQQTQAPVNNGDQGQVVVEAAGPSFPLTRFPVDIIDRNLDLPADTDLAVVNGPFANDFLLNVTNSNITGTGDAINVGNAHVKGVINSDPSTFSFTGNYLLVTGSETASGPQSADAGGTFDIGESFLNIAETGSLNSSAPAALQFDHSTVTTGNSLIFIDGTASLSGSLVQATDSNFENIGGDFLEVNGSLSATNASSPVLDIDPTMVATAGDFIDVTSTGSLATEGQLLTDTGGTYEVGGNFLKIAGNLNSTASQPALELTDTTVSTGEHFIGVSGGTVNLGGTFLATSGDPTLNIAGDLLHIASHVTGPSLGSVFDIFGGSVAATNLLFLAPDSTLDLSGSVLDQNGGTIAVTNVLNFQAPVTAPDTPLANVHAGALNADGALLVLGADLEFAGPVFAQTGGEVEAGTAVSVTGGTLGATPLDLFDIQGGTFTINDSFTNVNAGNVATEGDLFTIDGELPFTLNGSLLSQSGGAVEANNILNLEAAFTSSGDTLFDITGGWLSATRDVVTVAADSTLTLTGSLLDQRGGMINAGRSALLVNGGTVTGTGSNALFNFTNNAMLKTEGFDIASLFGGSLSLAGALVIADNSDLLLDDSILFTSGATVNGTGTVFAIQILNNSTVANNDDFPLIDLNGGTVHLAGGLGRFQDSTAESQNAILGITGTHVTSTTTTDPFLEFVNTTATTGGSFISDFAQIDQNARVEISSTFLHAIDSEFAIGTNPDATENLNLLEVVDGGQLVMNSPDSVLLIDGGSITVGTEANSLSHLVLLRGQDPDGAFDQPIIGGVDDGAYNPVGSLVKATNGAKIEVKSTPPPPDGSPAPGGNAVKLDTALLEASLPIINLISPEEAPPCDQGSCTTLTTANDTILADYAKIVSLGSLVTLDKSVINVTNGSLLTLVNGSYVKVQADLLRLINASRINIVNGFLIRADGGSTLDVLGAIANFGGTGGNLVQVNNNVAPTGTPGGVPVNTGMPGPDSGHVNINGPVIVNPGLGSITVNGAAVPNGDGFTGSLIQSTNNSTVNIGPPAP